MARRNATSEGYVAVRNALLAAQDDPHHLRTQNEQVARALLEMVGWTTGQFTFEPERREQDGTSSEVEIALDTREVLLDVLRRYDERDRLCPPTARDHKAPGQKCAFFCDWIPTVRKERADPPRRLAISAGWKQEPVPARLEGMFNRLGLMLILVAGCNWILPLGPAEPAGQEAGVDALVGLEGSVPGCPPSEVLCGGGCVDTDTDSSHCGMCGFPCATGQECKGGHCTCTPDSCGGCCSGATCVEVASQNAGGCGLSGKLCAACPNPGPTCLEAVCNTGICGFEVTMGCYIDGTCHDNKISLNVCEVCDEKKSKTAWTALPIPGCVVTIAGGPTLLELNAPRGIALGPGGAAELYVADTGNNRIARVELGTGVATTLASGFNQPEAVTVNDLGTVFVADTGNHCIRKVVGTTLSDVAGLCGASGSNDGNGSTARFDKPSGLALDGGFLFVADTGNAALRQITPQSGPWSVSTAPGMMTTLQAPVGLTVKKAGELLISDIGLNQVLHYKTLGGAFVKQITTGLLAPRGLDCHLPDLFIADSGNHRIGLYAGSAMTNLAGSLGSPGYKDGLAGTAQFNEPSGVAYDSTSKKLYIADTNNNCIRMYVLPL